MKNKNLNNNRNISDLSEDEIEQIKSLLISDKKIITNKPKHYDKKFFQTVLTSAKIVKICLFTCFALYALLNLFGIILSVVYNNLNFTTLIGQFIGCFSVSFVCIVIFNNINTNKKTEKEILYISNGKFVFNFNNGIVDSPDLFYCLSYESLQKIEFEIYGTRKRTTYGRVVFTFDVLVYQVTHTINLTNITQIENYIAQNYPMLVEKIIKDGKSIAFNKKSKYNKIKNFLYSLNCLIASLLFIVIPLLFDYFNLSLIIAGSVFLLTAIIVFISPYLYTYHLRQGLIVSTVFIIIGYLIPLFIILNSNVPFLEYLASNSLLLLITFFGNIGLTFYLYIVALVLNKFNYLIKSKDENSF